MKNIAVSIYCDEGLLQWIDSQPGRSRNEKIVELLRQTREHQEQSADASTLVGAQSLAASIVDLLLDKTLITEAEARQLLLAPVADANRLMHEKGKRSAAEYYNQ